jgi:hypothetical protein
MGNLMFSIALVTKKLLTKSPYLLSTICLLSSRNKHTFAKRMRIERDSATNTVTFHPNDGAHSATVILMHGLGDSADGLSDLGESWSRQLPHVKFILPTAENRPVTLNGGMKMNAW